MQRFANLDSSLFTVITTGSGLLMPPSSSIQIHSQGFRDLEKDAFCGGVRSKSKDVDQAFNMRFHAGDSVWY